LPFEGQNERSAFFGVGSLPSDTDVAVLVRTVQRNCDIADARHAREMTLCSYLLQMREFCRWQLGLPVGQIPARAEVAAWIRAREALWEELADAPFVPVPLAGEELEPFAADAINSRLLDAGLCYGGGLGRFGKPHFFLAELQQRQRRGPLEVLICGRELARDIAALPALLQGERIVLRREALGQWLAERIEAWSIRQTGGAMARALGAFGHSDGAAAALEAMIEHETETLILHEIGEWQAGHCLGEDWAAMVAAQSRRGETIARALRDDLADCLSTLPALIERRATASLHLWFATLEGMRRHLLPELTTAYEVEGDPYAIDGLLKASAARLVAAAQSVLAHWRQGGGVAARAQLQAIETH